MEIKGSGFILRTWKLQDAAQLQEHANNKNISDFLLDRFPSPYTLADALFFINLKLNEVPVTNFAIVIDNEVCGVIGVDLRQDIYRKTPLLGYWLSEKYHNRGIITNAVKLVTQYAFINLDIICIQAVVLGTNLASMRVLEKVGYIKQGILERSVIKNNKVFDEHIYTIHSTNVL